MHDLYSKRQIMFFSILKNYILPPCCCVQLFGCVDWAPSDFIATFLLAGVAQTCRRRSKVELIAAAGGVPEAPPRQSPSRDGESFE